jgi:hypothetical protein
MQHSETVGKNVPPSFRTSGLAPGNAGSLPGPRKPSRPSHDPPSSRPYLPLNGGALHTPEQRMMQIKGMTPSRPRVPSCPVYV